MRTHIFLVYVLGVASTQVSSDKIENADENAFIYFQIALFLGVFLALSRCYFSLENALNQIKLEAAANKFGSQILLSHENSGILNIALITKIIVEITNQPRNKALRTFIIV